MASLSSKYVSDLETALRKALGAGSVMITPPKAGHKHHITVIYDKGFPKVEMENVTHSTIKKLLGLGSYGIAYNSPRRMGSGLIYLGQFILDKRKAVKESTQPLEEVIKLMSTKRSKK